MSPNKLDLKWHIIVIRVVSLYNRVSVDGSQSVSRKNSQSFELCVRRLYSEQKRGFSIGKPTLLIRQVVKWH